MSPESRVFRPRNETEDKLIDALMKARAAQGLIAKPSWTLYAAWLVNRDLGEVRAEHKSKIGGK